MRIKIIKSLDYKKVEQQVNQFIQENENTIEVVDIQWKAFLEHYVMVIYKNK